MGKPMPVRIINDLKDKIAKLEAENQRLRDAHREIIEIYAGMEGGFIPETAPEAYCQRIISQMYEVSRLALKELEKGDEIKIYDDLIHHPLVKLSDYEDAVTVLQQAYNHILKYRNSIERSAIRYNDNAIITQEIQKVSRKDLVVREGDKILKEKDDD